jgi:biotin-dependent carboxylase-like uncharacterized protein
MPATPLFEVVDGGLLTTVQDAGRPDWTPLGVPISGAADPWSLAVANLLAGNDPGDAALELTVVGPTLRALRPVTIAIAGADLGGRAGGRRLPPGRSHRLAAGELVTFPGSGDASASRSILAVPGGFDVERLLGSRSTCLPGGFGGLDGRPLRAGDVLRGRDPATGPERAWPEADEPSRDGASGGAVLRVLPGPAPGLDQVLGRGWRVASASDRVGTRLDGPPLPAGIGGEATTFGVPPGAIQVPADGRPIILGPDHQTTGGYRVVGVVISADVGVLARLGPGAPVRLEATTPDEAVAALRLRHAGLVRGAEALRDADRWTDLAHAAGG